MKVKQLIAALRPEEPDCDVAVVIEGKRYAVTGVHWSNPHMVSTDDPLDGEVHIEVEATK